MFGTVTGDNWEWNRRYMRRKNNSSSPHPTADSTSTTADNIDITADNT